MPSICRTCLSTLALAALLASAQAAPTLIARGSLPGDAADLSGLSGTLENGAPANLLGGLGSALAWAGGSTFIALPDRGPNASAWNTTVDNTTSWVPRFHTLSMALSPNPAGPLPFTLTPTLTGTTLLWSRDALHYGPAVPAINTARRHFFSGRSDNFGPGDSLDPLHARLDPEGLRVSRNGKTVYISDEYGAYVYAFDRASGKRQRAFALPSATFAVNTLAATGAAEISGNTTGRVANKGMEGLAITPDGKHLIGFMQSPLLQDGGDGGRANRIVRIEIATGVVEQFAYDNFIPAMNKAYNSSEILAINSHEFLVLERDGKGLGDGTLAVVKQLWKVDLSGATEVSGLSGAAALLAVAPTKTLFLDLRAALNAAGIADADIPAKLEGAAFGEDVVIDGVTKHTLYLANDNDFLASVGGKDNPNQFFVFAFDDADLGGSVYEPQRFKQP
ncbi:esterase-like activity of phytase family protein [Ideonella sp. 4Y16]|uniref:esterase-like activity of phytase family protein n=1 Tax=Ideonella alba TaxID=2824118 RepID=UPI001B379646|nr:esterase-like activity of phytase family protein [Ideonella alba]MBQ0942678.1 esterase-like activity of phytase family protein [Ideonella alba]